MRSGNRLEFLHAGEFPQERAFVCERIAEDNLDRAKCADGVAGQPDLAVAPAPNTAQQLMLWDMDLRGELSLAWGPILSPVPAMIRVWLPHRFVESCAHLTRPSLGWQCFHWQRRSGRCHHGARDVPARSSSEAVAHKEFLTARAGERAAGRGRPALRARHPALPVLRDGVTGGGLPLRIEIDGLVKWAARNAVAADVLHQRGGMITNWISQAARQARDPNVLHAGDAMPAREDVAQSCFGDEECLAAEDGGWRNDAAAALHVAGERLEAGVVQAGQGDGSVAERPPAKQVVPQVPVEIQIVLQKEHVIRKLEGGLQCPIGAASLPPMPVRALVIVHVDTERQVCPIGSGKVGERLVAERIPVAAGNHDCTYSWEPEDMAGSVNRRRHLYLAEARVPALAQFFEGTEGIRAPARNP